MGWVLTDRGQEVVDGIFETGTSGLSASKESVLIRASRGFANYEDLLWAARKFRGRRLVGFQYQHLEKAFRDVEYLINEGYLEEDR